MSRKNTKKADIEEDTSEGDEIEVKKFKNKKDEEEELERLAREESDDDSRTIEEKKDLEETLKLLKRLKDRKEAYVKNYGPGKKHLFDNTPNGLHDFKRQLEKEGLYHKHSPEEIEKLEEKKIRVVESLELDSFCQEHTKTEKGEEILRRIIKAMVLKNMKDPFLTGLKFYNYGFYNCDFEDMEEVDKFLLKVKKEREED